MSQPPRSPSPPAARHAKRWALVARTKIACNQRAASQGLSWAESQDAPIMPGEAPRPPDPWDPSISKRQWEKLACKWRKALREAKLQEASAGPGERARLQARSRPACEAQRSPAGRESAAASQARSANQGRGSPARPRYHRSFNDTNNRGSHCRGNESMEQREIPFEGQARPMMQQQCLQAKTKAASQDQTEAGKRRG